MLWYSWMNYILIVLIAGVVEVSNSSSITREAEALSNLGWWGNQIPLRTISDHCNWIGIKCSETGRVISIDLGSGENSIGDSHGKFNVSSFPYLERLDLGDCGLVGSMHYQIGMLSKLNYLSLRNNYLTGQLPSSMASLTQLKILDLSNNSLGGSVLPEISRLKNLLSLDLSFNKFTGFIPRGLGNLSNLENLFLEQNQLTGTIPLALGSLTKLNKLNLSSNQFNGSMPVFKNCKSLHYLDLSHNLLTGNIPIELAYCHTLSRVILSYNNLSGGIPIEFQSLHFTYFDLSHNNLSGTIPNTYSQVPSPLSITPSEVSDGSLNYHPNKDASDDGSNKPGLTLLYIVLPLGIGLLILILAIIFVYRCATKENQIKPEPKNGDLFSVWNYDGKIAFEDIIRATNNFDIRYCIGTGGNGSVYKAKLPTGKTVALKKLHRFEAEEPDFDKSFRNEVQVLSSLRHRNIVKLYGFCLHNRCMFLVYEYMVKGSLFCALRDDAHARQLNWSKRVNIVKGIAHALSYMHHDCNPPVVHRDISSNNILLNFKMEASVADFGASRFLNPDSSGPHTVNAGTCGYIAPGSQIIPNSSDFYLHTSHYIVQGNL